MARSRRRSPTARCCWSARVPRPIPTRSRSSRRSTDITALQLEVLADDSLPHQGPGRQDNGNLHVSEIKLFVLPASGGEPLPVPIATAFADFNQQDWDVSKAIDGRPETAWGIYPEVGRSHWAVLVLAEPLQTGGHVRLSVELAQLHGRGHLIGRPRLSATVAADPLGPLDTRRRADALGHRAGRTNGRPARRVDPLAAHLADRWRVGGIAGAADCVRGGARFQSLGQFSSQRQSARSAHLRRGDVTQPLALAAPGAVVHRRTRRAFALDDPADEAGRRAALAHWLVDKKNVLTWRSIVNRVWHYHFGRGIVDTPNDLGRMGGQPSHPELLDWLAVEFRDRGGFDQGPAPLDRHQRHLSPIVAD